MKTLSGLFLIALAILFGCSGKNKLTLADRNFGEEIDLQTIMSFTFSSEMVPDSLVGVWSDEKYIRFEPEVEGKYHWQTASILVFAPKKGFDPATNYKARLTDKVFAYSNLKYQGEKEFSFHTPYLNIVSSRAFWDVPETGQEPGMRVEIEFNYKVSPEEAAKLLKVKLDGKGVQFKPLTEGSSQKISFLISDVKKEDKNFSMEISFDKGLVPENGKIKTTEVFVEKFDIPSPFKLEITDLQANHDGTEGTIMLYTTQMVANEDIKKYIKISPSVKYQLEIEPGYIFIRSEGFSMDQQYEISVEKGLPGRIGGTLKFDFSQPVSFGQVEPTIRFFNKKEYYLSGQGSRNLEVAILNVPKVIVTIHKIYENNLLKYLSNSNDYYDEYYYEEEYYYYRSSDVGDLGDEIYRKELETNNLPRKGSNRVLSLDFADKLADHKGMYVVEIRSAESYWLKATKLIAISDLGMIVKEGRNQVTVFINSIKKAQSLEGVNIRFIGRNNQVVYTTKTDGNGVARYDFGELKASGFDVTLVTATLGDDYNVIPVKRTRINTSRYDVGGKYLNPAGMEAFIYGDRDLYRPGETVNISAIVRDYSWQIPSSLPLIVKMVAPNGKTYKTLRKTLNKHGSFVSDIAIPASAQTGSYVVNVYTSNDVLIGSKVIKIEEFMPDRIKVDLSLNQKDYTPGQEIKVELAAENFFGPPASGRNYEVQLSTQRIHFSPKKNQDYSYYINGITASFSNEFRQSTTNEEGKASEVFPIPKEYRNMGILRSDVFATVFDETGRPVNRLKQLSIYTQNVFYGIKTEDYYIRTNAPAKFDLIAVDKNGEALENTDAQVKLIRFEYKTVLSESGGYFRYRSEKVEKVLQSKQIKLNGTSTSFSFTPDQSGQYELRVSAPGVSGYVSNNLYAYGWGSTSYGSFEVNREGQIDISSDKSNYNVGEKATILLKAPFTGKILVTMENNKVIDHFYIETDKRAASFSIEIKEEYLPNIYISATLFRPHEESDIPLTVAHGYGSVKVDNPSYKMPVTIEAVEKSRANTKQVIKVKSKPNSALTLAVVDEGILQVAGYATPDPYNFYYAKRALGVNTSNIYPYLFPEIGMIRSNTGGDGSEMEKRLNPMQNNRVKLVSFWSGILETNSKGEATWEIDIPQFSGDLRIMAVSYSGKTLGSAQGNMKVADPLVVSVALPRFLSPGDKVKVPVTLTNTTGKETRCKAILKVEGPLQIISESTLSSNIGASKEARIEFEIEAKKAIGQSKVILETQALGETFIHTTDINVRPASPLQKRSGSGSVDAGNTSTIPVDNKGFVTSSVDGKLMISKNPVVQFSKNLDYLVRYPYGCIEQTVSSAFPQIYFGDLVNSMYTSKEAKTDAVKNVQFALDRIKLMQLYNGGLTYWPGTGHETWWGSVYAAHFAIEAKKAGFEVDENFLNLLMKYIRKQLEKKELVTWYFNFNQKKQIAPREAIYSLYVLSLAGEKPVSLLNYYSTRTDQLSPDSKYMLAAAYALSGNMGKAKEVLPSSFPDEKSNKSTGGSFYSYIRDEALALNVLLDIDPQNPQVGVMAKHVSEALRINRYLNTQESIFSLLALGKISREAAASDIKGSVKTDGKVIRDFDNADLTISLKTLGSKAITITTSGSGRLFYFWETEGITEDGSFVQEDSYLKVRRAFYTRNGNITNNTFKQNDLVLVEISLEGAVNEYIENVAVADILPACFEIENPRITTLPPGITYPHYRSTAQYMDIRDDRIIYFTNVSSSRLYFYYLVRVVSKGKFIMGPVGADAMYNGEYHSYNGAGIITVDE